MEYIFHDENGIADRDTYLAVIKVLNRGRLIPFRNKINVASMRKMKGMNFSWKKHQIGDLDFLKLCKDIRDLSIVSKRLHSISPLSEQTKMETIYLEDASLDTLSPIISCQALTRVTFINVRISDNQFEPLGKLPKLKSLCLQNCNVTDIAWIAGHERLESIDLDETVVNDFSPLKTIPSLKYVCTNWRVFTPPFAELFDENSR